MQKTGRFNRNGIAILRNTDGYNTGRSIGQNLAVIGTLIKKAVSHDAVRSGGVNAK
jgi:hypothetical protein